MKDGWAIIIEFKNKENINKSDYIRTYYPNNMLKYKSEIREENLKKIGI